MERMPGELEDGLNRVAKEVAVSLIDDLIMMTPVDTSKALSNWRAGQAYPLTDEIDAHVPGNFGSTRGLSASKASGDAKVNISKKEPGVTLYISNSAEYITELNNGSSKQAPAGFVEASVSRAKRTIKSKSVLKRGGDKCLII